MSTEDVDKEIAEMGFHGAEEEEEQTVQDDGVIKPFWRNEDDPVTVLMVDKDSGQVKEVKKKKKRKAGSLNKKSGRRKRPKILIEELSDAQSDADDLFDNIEEELTLTDNSYEVRLTLKAKYQARIEKQKLLVRQKNAEIKRLQVRPFFNTPPFFRSLAQNSRPSKLKLSKN